MTKDIKRILASLLVIPIALLGLTVIGTPAYAAADPACKVTGTPANDSLSLDSGSKCAGTKNQGTDLTTVFRTVVNIMLFIVGAVAVIMLVIGGLRYVTSNGDQNAVSGAKNTILYAIIGIVVAFLAFAAVSFVTGQLEQGNNAGGGSAAGTP